MVSADNLPFDVLPLIFHFLTSGSDLVAVSLVSKSFSGGVLPLIYATITMRMSLVKRLLDIQSPFQTLLQLEHLRPFVRRIAIHAVTYARHVQAPDLLLQVAQVLAQSPNLISFAYTVPSPHSHLAGMLPSLVKHEKLKELKIIGDHVNIAQAELLAQVGSGAAVERNTSIGHTGADVGNVTSSSNGLEEIWLKAPSSAVMCVLTKWTERNSGTLKRLTFSESNSLSTSLLDNILSLLPNLTTLNVSYCPEVDHWGVLQLLDKVPALKSLNLHVLRHCPPPPTSILHTALKNLTISFTTSHSGSVNQLRTTILGFLTFFSASALESITLESTEFVAFPMAAILTLVQDHGKTLKRFNALRVIVEHDGVETICKNCPNLEQICIELGAEIKMPSNSLTAALSNSKSLHTLIDSLDVKPHHNHTSTQVRLSSLEAKVIFSKIPTLKRIVNANRCWTQSTDKRGHTQSQAHRLTHSTLSALRSF